MYHVHMSKILLLLVIDILGAIGTLNSVTSLEIKFIVSPVARPHRIDEWVSDFRIVEGLVAQPLFKD